MEAVKASVKQVPLMTYTEFLLTLSIVKMVLDCSPTERQISCKKRQWIHMYQYINV